ncbi:hypothetical protein DVA67_007280 [Solirubrobacter sp. CPCC 204708]|uniref:Uncharacterized protein n=1 Tax=Solirubrobacter deserti TaxID=2282478 RepID=A0ABT4RKM4_9ACTN|nr:hypothetical protein [Solirubrobacter deserti]MBE2315772.1 hypothetical protein [Solirubrobacter deserti]MDA0138891.1 hypothetical protein [Solirubrobacter deserti]
MTAALGLLLAATIPMDLAVDHTGRAFEVGRTSSSVAWRVAAPRESFGPWRTLLRLPAGQRPVRAALAEDGRGLIALHSGRAPGRRVRVAGIDAAGRVGRLRTVTRGSRADLAALAVARGGAAVVVWYAHRPDGRWRLEAAARDPGDGAFGRPQAISPLQRVPCCTAVAAAIGDRGDVVLTWRSTLRPTAWAALRAAGARFRPPHRLAAESSDVPRAAIGADGTAAVVYSLQRVPLRPGDGLRLHRAPAGEPFGAAEVVNPGGGVTLGDVTVTRAGHTAVAWVEPAGARVRLSEAGPGMPLSVAAVLGANAAPRAPVLAAGDDGRAVVAWTARAPSSRSPDERVMAAQRVASPAGFGEPVALGEPWPSAAPRIVRLSPGARALVLWTRTGRRHSAHAVTRVP